MRSRHAYGILKMMGVTQTIAQDEAEYIEIAVRLGVDADWRQHIVQKIYERQSLLYNDTTCVTALESFYQQIVLQQLSKSSKP
jgi:predicted O-linked N-acetylglucosamine transferase (SPINDLY family)